MVYIDEKDWNKIIGYATIAHKTMKAEIGGMSVMVQDNDQDWKLMNPIILKQQVSGGNTILCKEALAEYYTKECKRLGKKNFRFCWWHSHHTMAAFWSSTDLTAIDEYSDGDFSFALVVNLKEEYKFRISVWNPVEVHEDVELEIVRKEKYTKKMETEVSDLCSKITVAAKTSYNYGSYIKPYNQTSLWLDTKKDEPFEYTDILEIYSDVVNELVDGTIKHKDYVDEVDLMNRQLKDEKSQFRIKAMSKKITKDNILYRTPDLDIIYAKNNKVVKVEDVVTDDWTEEDKAWNASFGVNGYGY